MSQYEFETQYASPSGLIGKDNHRQLRLVSSKSKETNPTYFSGELKFPYETAKCLRALSNLVVSRFYIPPAMLAKILREADPVVTTSQEMLRFEGFSSCCSSYGRLDINKDGFTAEKLIPGTTNVDFQASMRSALAKVRSSDDMNLCISQQEVHIETSKDAVIERKVKLPLRWIKGFSELQAQQLSAKQYFQLTRAETIRFLRQIPRSKTREFTWISQMGKSIRLLPTVAKNSFKLKGLERLKLLEELAPQCETLTVYADDKSSLSCWVLKLGALTYTLVLSAEPWRGFSGEGNLLKDLAVGEQEELTARVASTLKWQQSIKPEELARQLNEKPQVVSKALALLASRGLVGFDIVNQCFFHRVLPFEKELAEKMHPRLVAAKKLIEKDAVVILDPGIKNNDAIKSSVKSSDINHQVVIDEVSERCTCPWFAKYQGDRGPCKHVLATYLALEKTKAVRETW